MNRERPHFFSKKQKQEHILWTSASYFSNRTTIAKETLTHSLQWDIITFLHEYVGLQDKKVYPYGKRGIMDAYYLPTSQICRHHEQSLKSQGFEVTRAQLETKTALTVEAWMDDPTITIGEKLFIISPRGKINEGYPGLDPENYVFINVYTKIGNNEVQLIQYTSYALEKDLQHLQDTLRIECQAELYQPDLSAQLEEEISIKSLSHQIINTPLLLSSTISFTDIEEYIYKNEKDPKKGWVTTRDDLPQVDEIAFNEQLQQVLEMLLNQFWILAAQTPNVAIGQFDQLISIVREHFLKWVEDHAYNYTHDEILAPYALNIESILERWQLAIKQQQQKLDTEEVKKLKKIEETVALNPLQPLMRASSVAHCIVGTPQSLAMQMMRLNPNILSISSPEFKKLKVAEKQNLLDKIRLEQMTEIHLENGETWMVPVSFLEGKGCYVDEFGVAMGPCDIPLEESFAFKMTAEEFQRFVYELEQHLLEDELSNVEATVIHDLDSTVHNHDLFKEKIAYIKSLIFKPIVSITELISGDFVHTTFGKSDQIRAIITQIRFSHEPIKTCEKIIEKLLQEQNGVLQPSNV